MRILCSDGRRGFGMLGLMSLIALMAFLCAAVSISSSRSVAGSVRGIQRLQVLAAAEGAALLIQAGSVETSGTVQLGDCRVTFAPAAVDGVSTAVMHQLRVEIPVGDRIAYSRSFVAAPDAGSGNIFLKALP